MANSRVVFSQPPVPGLTDRCASGGNLFLVPADGKTVICGIDSMTANTGGGCPGSTSRPLGFTQYPVAYRTSTRNLVHLLLVSTARCGPALAAAAEPLWASSSGGTLIGYLNIGRSGSPWRGREFGVGSGGRFTPLRRRRPTTRTTVSPGSSLPRSSLSRGSPVTRFLAAVAGSTPPEPAQWWYLNTGGAMTTVGLLHPGEMGAAVGGCLVSVGHTVLWDPAGRSRASTGRALGAGLSGEGMAALLARSSVILSICPPHAALDVARQIAGSGYGGIYVDANAISMATAAEVAAVVTAGGASYVDGGIIGPPPEAAGHTRLYLSGERAAEVQALFGRSALEARIAEGQAFAASAVKMAYAAWTKGASALLLAARALARAEGVEQALLGEWALSQPALGQQSERAAGSAASKGWRWVAEMQEIAASMTAAGLPDGFHQAAAEIFDRAAGSGHSPAAGRPGHGSGTTGSGTLDTVISALT
jgi:3-hydroxyisobutyrate dehydrogenase-like beta-hydroxyacid dehydrogenase